MNQTLATVISNRRIRPNMYLLRVEAPAIASEASPGQFVMVRTADNHELLLRRPLAIQRVAPTSAPREIGLVFRIVGRGTAWLARRRQGEPLDLLGPLGNGFDVRCDNILLVAGGMGIAPLVALADRALARGARVTFILGAPSEDDLYPPHLLPPQLELRPATEDGSIGKKGLASDLLSKLPAGFKQVFACGPPAMYRAMSGHPSLRGKPVQVSMEARMGCGFGVCLGCAIETKKGMKLVCQDGPVFDLEEIVWSGDKGGV